MDNPRCRYQVSRGAKALGLGMTGSKQECLNCVIQHITDKHSLLSQTPLENLAQRHEMMITKFLKIL